MVGERGSRYKFRGKEIIFPMRKPVPVLKVIPK
jgi:hypothetical protein